MQRLPIPFVAIGGGKGGAGACAAVGWQQRTRAAEKFRSCERNNDQRAASWGGRFLALRMSVCWRSVGGARLAARVFRCACARRLASLSPAPNRQRPCAPRLLRVAAAGGSGSAPTRWPGLGRPRPVTTLRDGRAGVYRYSTGPSRCSNVVAARRQQSRFLSAWLSSGWPRAAWANTAHTANVVKESL